MVDVYRSVMIGREVKFLSVKITRRAREPGPYPITAVVGRGAWWVEGGRAVGFGRCRTCYSLHVVFFLLGRGGRKHVKHSICAVVGARNTHLLVQ